MSLVKGGIYSLVILGIVALAWDRPPPRPGPVGVHVERGRCACGRPIHEELR